VLRWLLAAVLTCFVILRVYGAVRFTFLLADQSASFYIVKAIIDLGPAAVEAVAVVLALRGRGGRAGGVEHSPRLRSGAARGSVLPHDLWLADTCVAHGLTMVTGNVREFARVPGLELEVWEG